MNKIIIIMAIFVLFVAGCSNTHNHEGNLHEHDDYEKLSNQMTELPSNPIILTTFYPVEEITKAIVQDTATVNVLIGTGVEPHSFEPTPKQIVDFSKSDIFVTMEGMFEHVEDEIIDSNLDIIIIDTAHNLELISGDGHAHEDEHHEEHAEEHHEEELHEHDDEHTHEEESHEDNHDHGEYYDPHVWLSIHNMETMTNEILEQLVDLYPKNKELYEANAQTYLNKLKELKKEYTTNLSHCHHSEIIVNHMAFGYLAHEYGFEQVSVAGFSPESEPSPKTIQKVVDEAKEHNLKYVFSEGQLDNKVANTIANDIGGEVLELNPIKTNEDENYFSIMKANLDNLVKGLDCNPE